MVGVLISVVAAGSATASKLLTGGDIKNGSLTAADIRNGSLTGSDMRNGTVGTSSLADGAVTRAKLAPGVLATLDRADRGTRGDKGEVGLQGLTGSAGGQGPAGLAGDQGDRGPDGIQGPPGQSLVSSLLTPPNVGHANANVLDVPSVASNDPGPGASEGVALVPPAVLTQGQYLVQSSVRYSDFSLDGDGIAYGVTRTFFNGLVVEGTGTSWSSDIPDDDPINAAQSFASSLVVVPAGGGTLSLRTLVRGGAGVYQAGASVIITELG